jgi:hypothetical protein
MGFTAKILALAALAATLAHTQTLPHFQHIIILFQENRTPDNLFGGNTTFEPGVDLQQSQLGQPWCLGACFDPNHSHASFEAIWNPGNGQAPMCNGRLITQTPNNAQVNGNPGCDLRAVSWVIPWGDRSDHPGLASGQDSRLTGFGPSWVAAVINSVGNTTCTDTINGKQVPYWQDTAIFVIWDDFGGFWDHVNPAASAGGPGVKINNPPTQICDSTKTFGCGYIYGFRVPLLVVSAYTPAGYVSGSLPSPGETFPYVHDFGSILAFIENNFLGSGEIGQINPAYQFADAFAPDYKAPPNLHIPLADFFTLITPRQFQSIVLPPAWQSYDANYFLNYNGPVMDPDNDAIDND